MPGSNRLFNALARRSLLAGSRRSALALAIVLAALLILPPSLASGAFGSTRLDWGSKTPMPTARFSLGLAAAPSGKLYAVGGYNGSGACPPNTYCARVEEYDPATNFWTPRAPLLTSRLSLGLAAAPNGKLYAVGGSHANGTVHLATVEEYDPAADQWTPRAPMSAHRIDLGLATAPNGRLYAVGGYNEDKGFLPAKGFVDTVEEYDPVANSWATLPVLSPLTPARFGLGVAAGTNGRLYAIGGRSGNTRFDTTSEYDPATDTWTTKTSMTQVRQNLGVAVASNGKLYAVGGYAPGAGGCQPDGYCATVEEYDPTTDTWTTKASLHVARTGPGLAASPNGKLYAVGGTTSDAACAPSGYCATVEEYAPATNTWVTKAPMPTPRQDLGLATAPNGKLYAVGGFNASGVYTGFLGQVEEYDPASNTWAVPPPLSQLTPARSALGLATGANGRLYAIGGRSGGTFFDTTVEYDPATDGWQARAGMPDGGRDALGVAAHPNGKIYAVGGGNAVNYLGRLEEYNPATDTWRGAADGLPALAVPRQSLGVAVGSNGKLYAAGGLNAAGDRAELEEYTVGAGAWVSRSLMIDARQSPGFVATPDGKLYAIGGYNNANGGALKSVEVYDIASDQWSGRPGMPTARYALSAVLGPNGHIYAIGGQKDGTTYLNVVEEFDPVARTWRTVAPLPTARTGFGLTLGPNQQFFAIGGFNDATVANGGCGGDCAVNEVGKLTELPTASAGGPYSVPAGAGPVALTGSGADPEGSALSFAWDLDGDLLYETAGQNPSFSTSGLAPGVYPVRVRAADTRGGYGLASTTLTVTSPTHLVFSTQPSGAQAGSLFSPQPVVQALDAQDRIVPGFTGQITLAFGTNAGGSILGGTPARDAASGVATYTDLFATAAGAGYTLVASAPGLASATSAPFTITAAPPTLTPTPTLTPVPPPPTAVPTFCNPRPNLAVTTVPAGPGQLQARLTAQVLPATSLNSLQHITITAIDNATVLLNGSPVAAGASITLPGGTAQVTLLLQRQQLGAASLVSFVVTDVCGDWPSFVGGGPGAF